MAKKRFFSAKRLRWMEQKQLEEEFNLFPKFWSLAEDRPQHGFARNSKDWKVHHEPKVDVNTGDVELVLELKNSEETQKMWDKKFIYTYKIVLKEKTLDLKVSVKNDGEDEFDLTFCFHTYFTTSACL